MEEVPTSSDNGVSKQPDSESKEPKHPVFCPNPELFIPLPVLKFPKAAAVVFVMAIGCFAVSYDGDLVFDDSEAITGNEDIKPERPLSDIFVHDFWGKVLDKYSHKSYRPLTVLTFRWSYYLAGGLENTVWFHVPNIILHGIISAILVRVFSVLFGGYVVSKSTGAVVFKSPRSSFLCAMLFAVHPVHAESVSGIVGRADLLCALLFVLSFYMYVRACSVDLTAINDRGSSYQPVTFSIPLILVSMAMCCMSVLCKEQGITVIGICSAYDIIVICGVDLLQILGLKTHPSSDNHGNERGKQQSKDIIIQPWVASLIKRHLFLISTGILILVTRAYITGSAPVIFKPIDNPHSFVNGTVLRTVNYNYLYTLNSWLLINPWWLCFDWSMGCVPVLESLTDPRVIPVLILWGIVSALLYTSLKDHVTQDQRILTMSLALVIVPFLPASNLFFRVGFVIAERILYLPSIGVCLLIVLGFRQACRAAPQYAKLLTVGFLFLLSAYTVKSVQRSSMWTNEMDLFSSGAWVCPLNGKVHYNIAKLHADLGNTDYAIEKYRLAMELNTEYDQAMNNLGNVLKDKGELVEAENLLHRAVQIRKDFAAAWMNLGIVKASLAKFSQAELCYGEALKHRKKYPDCYYNLGNLYLDVKRHEQALQAWRNATNLKKTHLNAWSNIVVLLDNLGRYLESANVTHEALQYLPNEPVLLFNLGNVYGKVKRFEESEQYFLKTLKLAPNVAKYHHNLGVLYHFWEKYDKAEKEYQITLNMDPNQPGLKSNMEMLYATLNKKQGS